MTPGYVSQVLKKYEICVINLHSRQFLALSYLSIRKCIIHYNSLTDIFAFAYIQTHTSAPLHPTLIQPNT